MLWCNYSPKMGFFLLLFFCEMQSIFERFCEIYPMLPPSSQLSVSCVYSFSLFPLCTFKNNALPHLALLPHLSILMIIAEMLRCSLFNPLIMMFFSVLFISCQIKSPSECVKHFNKIIASPLLTFLFFVTKLFHLITILWVSWIIKWKMELPNR